MRARHLLPILRLAMASQRFGIDKDGVVPIGSFYPRAPSLAPHPGPLTKAVPPSTHTRRKSLPFHYPAAQAASFATDGGGLGHEPQRPKAGCWTLLT
jgi:hypothetical protein